MILTAGIIALAGIDSLDRIIDHVALMYSKSEPRVIPSPNRSPKISGSDRNSMCDCGCGKKRKRCPKNRGHIHITPPAHTLTQEQYLHQVREELVNNRMDVTAEEAADIYTRYYESHILSYWRDEMITPVRCVALIIEMFHYDQATELGESNHGQEQKEGTTNTNIELGGTSIGDSSANT
jgi:hypothetical protein